MTHKKTQPLYGANPLFPRPSVFSVPGILGPNRSFNNPTCKDARNDGEPRTGEPNNNDQPLNLVATGEFSYGGPRLLSSLVENLLQLGDDGIAHILGAGSSLEVLGPDAVVEGGLDGGLDGIGLLGEVQRVAQHHGDRQDGADGVDDALAGDIGRRTWGGGGTQSAKQVRRLEN